MDINEIEKKINKIKIDNKLFIKEYLANPKVTINKYNKIGIYYYGHKCKILEIFLEDKCIYEIEFSSNLIIKTHTLYNEQLILNNDELNTYSKKFKTFTEITLTKEQFIKYIDKTNWDLCFLIKLYKLTENEIIHILQKFGEDENTFIRLFIYNLKLSTEFWGKYIDNMDIIMLDNLCILQKLNEPFIKKYINLFDNYQLKSILKSQKLSDKFITELKVMNKFIT